MGDLTMRLSKDIGLEISQPSQERPTTRRLFQLVVTLYPIKSCLHVALALQVMLQVLFRVKIKLIFIRMAPLTHSTTFDDKRA